MTKKLLILFLLSLINIQAGIGRYGSAARYGITFEMPPDYRKIAAIVIPATFCIGCIIGFLYQKNKRTHKKN
ncbi:hypothetical protein A3F66_06600 [candidate division TM6 bacterium RIFCSPHIGHO2_12_FULL_32_22]|nr:MAG: hypothetical protein A3F66_06600 [candidate division TM6 bacterium RIFCSPHIGHO2_12_FULL_32_22]